MVSPLNSAFSPWGPSSYEYENFVPIGLMALRKDRLPLSGVTVKVTVVLHGPAGRG